jgi:hypothetical protein
MRAAVRTPARLLIRAIISDLPRFQPGTDERQGIIPIRLYRQKENLIRNNWAMNTGKSCVQKGCSGTSKVNRFNFSKKSIKMSENT